MAADPNDITVWIVWRAASNGGSRALFGVYANEITARVHAKALNATLKTLSYEVEEVEVQQ
jgi:hypothetical protein